MKHKHTLDIFLMTDQPPTCPVCGTRVRIIRGAETANQVAQCPNCKYRYRLQADEEDET